MGSNSSKVNVTKAITTAMCPNSFVFDLTVIYTPRNNWFPILCQK